MPLPTTDQNQNINKKMLRLFGTFGFGQNSDTTCTHQQKKLVNMEIKVVIKNTSEITRHRYFTGICL